MVSIKVKDTYPLLKHVHMLTKFSEELIIKYLERFSEEALAGLDKDGYELCTLYFKFLIQERVNIYTIDDSIEFRPKTQYKFYIKKRLYDKILCKVGKPVYKKMVGRGKNNRKKELT